MSESQSQRRILRSIGAVFAGLVAVFVLSLGTDVLLHASGIYPPWFKPMSTPLWLLATGYRIVYGIVGGYIATSARGYHLGPNSGPSFQVPTTPSMLSPTPMTPRIRACCVGLSGSS